MVIPAIDSGRPVSSTTRTLPSILRLFGRLITNLEYCSLGYESGVGGVCQPEQNRCVKLAEGSTCRGITRTAYEASSGLSRSGTDVRSYSILGDGGNGP